MMLLYPVGIDFCYGKNPRRLTQREKMSMQEHLNRKFFFMAFPARASGRALKARHAACHHAFDVLCS
jgi:hypothetical protein